MMNWTDKGRASVLDKELQAVRKQEEKLRRAALRGKPAAWKQALENRIPGKVYTGLESTFCKAFALVFVQGRGIIEKSCSPENIRADYEIRDYAVGRKGGRKEFRQMHREVRQADLRNMAATAAEGIALGALGVGMPDIVLFLSTLLKGIYETALGYGFDWESRREQLLILKMMATALRAGESWDQGNTEVDKMLVLETTDITEAMIRRQMDDTASAFAVDMLLLKFIQGIPVAGVLGGAANPVYYRKIMNYIRLKYRKRYLLKKKA